MSKKHPTLGYKKITGKLREAGFVVGRKRVQRVGHEEGLPVPSRRKKQLRRRVSTGLPRKVQHRNHLWS